VRRRADESIGGDRPAAKVAALAAVANDPTNGTALAGWAYSLAAFGDPERAREWTSRALLLDPDNLNMRYNLACTLIRQLGDPDEAVEVLAPFFERLNSTTLLRHLEVDPDLDPIRKDPRFQQMAAAARVRLEATQPAK
jgi:adenylate cyclase